MSHVYIDTEHEIKAHLCCKWNESAWSTLMAIKKFVIGLIPYTPIHNILTSVQSTYLGNITLKTNVYS